MTEAKAPDDTPTMEETAASHTVAPANRNVFRPHGYPEKQVDLGEVCMNYAEGGSSDRPALLLIPGQTESWWGYEQVMKLLEADYHVFAIDLRGQGRTTWTPGRYTFDNFGNDVVRFLATVVKRPVIVAGNSSGGVLSAWLAAYAMPGQIRAALLEDPPLFACERNPKHGHSILQAGGPVFKMFNEYLGDQWKVGDWQGFTKAFARFAPQAAALRTPLTAPEPPLNIQEYDPEWGRAFYDGTVSQSSPHDQLLASVKVPILLTQHMRVIDPVKGNLIGAISDFQVEQVKRIVEGAGVPFEHMLLADAMHQMHIADPARYVKVLSDWASRLPAA